MNTPIHILLVEDDAIDRQSFVRAVRKQRLPYRYVIADDLESARRDIAEKSFDIVICDYVLSDGTALDFINQHRDLPVIVVTGAGDQKTAVDLMKAGAKDYLVKDIDSDYLKIMPKAIENTLQRLELEAEQRDQRMFTDRLHQIARVLNSTLDISEVLQLILENIKAIIPHDTANIMLIEDGVARIVRHSGWSAERIAAFADFEFHVASIENLEAMYRTGGVSIINDVASFAGWIHLDSTTDPASYLGAPIRVDGEVIGFVNLDSNQRDHFIDAHAEKLQAFVSQVGIALKNARLYQQVAELSAFEERQRLARDLHDSVSQTLFATSVMSNALIKRWRQDPASIGEQLSELRDLTVGALAEMRTLLFELRPDALLQSRLDELLRQLLETMRGRTRLKIDFVTDGEYALAPDVHTAFFRIAQEALSNIIKHARATHVTVHLRGDAEAVTLHITDDGRGFDMVAKAAQNFGLDIMRERALAVGIDLTISSQSGHGTMIAVVYARDGGTLL
ncbi:MAG: response regulator [Anaerolineaceae bacterium]|nr:MAG: response regulator [Anaerolineaceae bacterium]